MLIIFGQATAGTPVMDAHPLAVLAARYELAESLAAPPAVTIRAAVITRL